MVLAGPTAQVGSVFRLPVRVPANCLQSHQLMLEMPAATAGHVDQVSRGIYVSTPSQKSQLDNNRPELVPYPSCSSQSQDSSVDNKMTRENAERMCLEHQEASASSGVAREGRQAAVALPNEGEGNRREPSASSSSAWNSDRSLTYTYLKDLRKFDKFYGQNPDRSRHYASSNSNPMSSPDSSGQSFRGYSGQ